jgi:hypothetical protein
MEFLWLVTLLRGIKNIKRFLKKENEKLSIKIKN